MSWPGSGPGWTGTPPPWRSWPAAAPSGLLQPWYSKRNFVLIHEAAHEDLLWSRELADVLTEGFEFLLPYYAYILSVSADPDPRFPDA